MKKIALGVALHILAASPLAVHAVSLNPKGLGQALIYPYYTVNKNQDTYFSVSNAADVGKVVRVRFHEGYNGRNVLDFMLYLSAHDTWTATVSAPDATSTSGARLSWSDNSCTDDFPKNPYPFLSYDYDGGAGNPPDSGPQTIARTREGHVEVIALADIVPGSQLEKAITHVQPNPPTPNGGIPSAMDGAPGRCPGVSSLVMAEGQLATPTSGLFGSGAIVNVGEGTFYAYNAEAITGFTDVLLFTSVDNGRNVTLDKANSSDAANGTARAYVFTDKGAPLTLDYANGYDAVSAVFMADALHNDYLVGAGLGANTDWVVTFPTKRFYVDQQTYAGHSIAPFDGPFEKGRSNTSSVASVYDREEGSPPGQLCGDPVGPNCPRYSPNLAYEVNVINLQSDPGPKPGYVSSVLGSTLTPDYISRWGDTGWIKLDLYAKTHVLQGGRAAGASVDLRGLPATGFMVYNIINSNAQPGKLANYSGLFPHRASLSCSGNTRGCNP